ncbi:MAG TPA: hypothetical protein VHL08_09390 [Dongiaceae bacterium]|jgi:hypothetical protein|nr:hypothetical protein [Dongiaceae bacterium]
MKKIHFAAIGLGLLMTACASTYEPSVDLQGRDQVRYEHDLAACRQIAQNKDVGTEAGLGALGGGVIGGAGGAVGGAIAGDAGTGAAIGAGSGAVIGAGAGAFDAGERQKQIVDDCLRHRGYRVY